jgi:peptidoglycan-associated lipoprotein
MKLKKLVQMLLVGCTVLALSGCAAKHGAGYNGGAGGPGADGGAEVNGLGEGENFGGDGAAGAGSGGHRQAKGNTYYFEYDSYAVHPDDKASISAHANRLVRSGKHAIVEGHTDPRGSREYNIALGERRANSVADLMKSKGVGANQVRVVSYGAERPAAQGRTEQDFQLDRRAVIAGQG